MKYITKMLDIIFPPKCAGCNKISRLICADCLSEITRVSMQDCARCKTPPHSCTCKNIRYIEELVFPYFYYGEKLKFAIYKLKKANLYYINEFFAKGMYNSAESGDKINLEEINFIACTPRARKSVSIYGYNQSENLAKLIAEYSGIKFENAVKLNRFTAPQQEQKTLGRNDRFLNVQGKFRANKKIDIAGKNIILIDDVATTGATLSECARVLKDAGAGKIYALCAVSAWN